MNPAELVVALAEAYKANADPAEAKQMSAYMRDQFPFFGIRASARRALDREIAGRGPGRPEHHYLVKVARECWAKPEREFQYFATDYLRRHHRRLDRTFIDIGRELVVSKAWWDTVDGLAGGAIGPYVRHNRMEDVMDVWIQADNVWVVRAALLHQLAAKEETDVERLFTYALQRSADTDPFIRKAIGWSLRQYAKTDPVIVKKFVDSNADSLSPLSVREALKNLVH